MCIRHIVLDTFATVATKSYVTFKPDNTKWIINVPDSKSRNIPEVVLVRRWAGRVLGIWREGGLGEGWGKWGQFTSNLRPRWTIPVTAGGCQVSKGGYKGETKRN